MSWRIEIIALTRTKLLGSCLLLTAISLTVYNTTTNIKTQVYNTTCQNVGVSQWMTKQWNSVHNACEGYRSYLPDIQYSKPNIKLSSSPVKFNYSILINHSHQTALLYIINSQTQIRVQYLPGEEPTVE